MNARRYRNPSQMFHDACAMCALLRGLQCWIDEESGDFHLSVRVQLWPEAYYRGAGAYTRVLSVCQKQVVLLHQRPYSQLRYISYASVDFFFPRSRVSEPMPSLLRALLSSKCISLQQCFFLHLVSVRLYFLFFFLYLCLQ